MKQTTCSTMFAHCYVSGKEGNSTQHTIYHISTWCYHQISHWWTSPVPSGRVRAASSAGRQSVKNSCEHSKHKQPLQCVQFKTYHHTSAIKQTWRFSIPPLVLNIFSTVSRQWKENLPTIWSSSSCIPSVARAGGMYLDWQECSLVIKMWNKLWQIGG